MSFQIQCSAYIQLVSYSYGLHAWQLTLPTECTLETVAWDTLRSVCERKTQRVALQELRHFLEVNTVLKTQQAVFG